MRYLLLILMSALFASCDTDAKKLAYIYSNDKDSLVEGYYMLDEDDVQFIPKLFERPCDERITHILRHKGMSVYRLKMGAMRKMSGLQPPHNLTNRCDSTIIRFYREWAIEKGYLK